MNSPRTAFIHVVAAFTLLVLPGSGFASEASEVTQSSQSVQWVKIPGGSFRMGLENRDEGPVHHVKITTFELAKTEVTIGQYRTCVEAGVCSPVDSTCQSASNLPTGDDYPVHCVNWSQAKAFSEWVGGRLPSESEWEYAARSGGKKQTYPWGNKRPSCEHAVFRGMNCGRPATAPVCSKPLGNTAQGLCDMGGNVSEWVADRYHISYQGAPADGSAWDTSENLLRVARGGIWFERKDKLRLGDRGFSGEKNKCLAIGFRPVREIGASGDVGGLRWVKIPGGGFKMKPITGGDDKVPVNVSPFEMSKAEVTFKQYHDCVRAGACTPEDVKCATEGNLHLTDDDRPVMCVDWFQAKQFARWVGGRLPTDVEWEYAAHSAGKERLYPWGDDEPTCDRAVFNGEECGAQTTRAVCSSPLGNTDQGLCDMAGNVGEWVEDRYLVPAAGEERGDKEYGQAVRPHRGGSWYDGIDALRAVSRDMVDQSAHSDDTGFRPARTLPK